MGRHLQAELYQKEKAPATLEEMGTSQSKKVAPAKPVVVLQPNAEMIDLHGTVGSHPRFQIGVTEFFFPWLSGLVLAEGGSPLPAEISTEQLVWGPKCQGTTGPSPMKWNIAEETVNTKCSFIVWCLGRGLTTDKEGHPLFAPVTTFVSHAWKGSFIALQNSITQHAKLLSHKSAAATPAFFLDIFVVNQHTPPWKEMPVVGMDYALKQPIELSLKTLLVMSPFEDPIPLKRAWCIYEICNTKRLGASLDITMPAQEHKRFIKALTCGEFDFNDWITNIDIEKAGAYDPNDKAMIMDLVTKSPGSVPGLNRTVVIALCEWLSTQGYLALQQIPEEDRGASELLKNLANVIWRQGKPDEAEPLYKDMVQGRRAVFGDEDVRTLAGLHVWGRFQRAKGQTEEALKVLLEVVTGREKVLGRAHEDTLASNMELAEVHRGMNNIDKAESLIKDVIQGWRDVFKSLDNDSDQGNKKSDKELHFIHVNFLESLKVQAAVMLQKGKGNRSETDISAILTELYDGRVKLFGERNPATLDVVVLRAQHQLAIKATIRDENLSSLEDALALLRGSLGDTHPRTLNCMCILSQMLKVLMEKDTNQQERIANGHTDRSMNLITEAVQGYYKTLGGDHPDTKLAISLKKCRAEDIAGFVDRYNSCFSPDCNVLLADGVTTKRAADIEVGDTLWTPSSGKVTVVTGHIIQKQDQHCRELIQIGDMLISKMHRIQSKGVWIRPVDYPNAVSVTKPSELHNFIVENLVPIVVNGIVVSTIGTFCQGQHQSTQPNHALWASSHIVTVFQHHPHWPVVSLNALEDNWLQVIKHKEFASEYLARCPLKKCDMYALLMKYGWKQGGVVVNERVMVNTGVNKGGRTDVFAQLNQVGQEIEIQTDVVVD